MSLHIIFISNMSIDNELGEVEDAIREVLGRDQQNVRVFFV